MMVAPVSAPASAVAEWGVAARAIPGEVEAGDLHVVAPFADGVLVAAIDGLGHGPEAAEAARAAAAVLQAHAGESVAALVERCHVALRRTRGAVLSLASFRATTGMMTWLGIGNIEGVVFRADPSARPPREAILLRSGVVGYQLPPLREATLSVSAGDTLIFATDGIRHDFAGAPPGGRPPQTVADDIIARYGKTTDDALVLVVRYLVARS
jgi:negative regulator of sigma-B (phosphoserine phosphatase)